MRQPLFVILSIVLLLVAACAPDAQPTVHDVYLHGLDGESSRYSLFYGAPTEFVIDGETVTLADGSVDAPLVVPGALLVDGQPHLTTEIPAIEAPVSAARIPLTTSLQIRTTSSLERVVYYDGQMWLSLLDEAAAGLDRRVAPRPRIGRLRGVGALSTAEADALADHLEQRGGPLVVAALPADALPQRTIDGLAEYRVTGLYVQDVIGVDRTLYEPPPERLAWEIMAQGSQASGFEAPAFRIVESERELLELWNRAYASRLDLPPLPDVSFQRETILAVFQGQQPTGGYGIEVSDVVIDGQELFVDLSFLEPAPDAMTTQALTSPWVLIRVLRGGIDVAWFRDSASGALLGVARSGD